MLYQHQYLLVCQEECALDSSLEYVNMQWDDTHAVCTTLVAAYSNKINTVASRRIPSDTRHILNRQYGVLYNIIGILFTLEQASLAINDSIKLLVRRPICKTEVEEHQKEKS